MCSKKKIGIILLAVIIIVVSISTVFAKNSSKKGDINGNGKIDMSDYVLCK